MYPFWHKYCPFPAQNPQITSYLPIWIKPKSLTVASKALCDLPPAYHTPSCSLSPRVFTALIQAKLISNSASTHAVAQNVSPKYSHGWLMLLLQISVPTSPPQKWSFLLIWSKTAPTPSLFIFSPMYPQSLLPYRMHQECFKEAFVPKSFTGLALSHLPGQVLLRVSSPNIHGPSLCSSWEFMPGWETGSPIQGEKNGL